MNALTLHYAHARCVLNVQCMHETKSTTKPMMCNITKTCLNFVSRQSGKAEDTQVIFCFDEFIKRFLCFFNYLRCFLFFFSLQHNISSSYFHKIFHCDQWWVFYVAILILYFYYSSFWLWSTKYLCLVKSINYLNFMK